MNITILTSKNSWLNDYNKSLAGSLIELGHSVNIIHKQEEMKKGDIAFLLGCFELIKKDTLNLNKHNIVVHESALPEGKGWSPITWQILEGKNVIPITLFEAAEEMDAGPIYFKDEINLNGMELVDEIREQQANKTIELCLSFVKSIDSINGHPQSGESTFYRRRRPEDSELDINKPIKEQFNLLRVVDNENYPAFFKMNGVKYILKIYKGSNE